MSGRHVTTIETFSTAKARTEKAKFLRASGFTVKVGKYKRECVRQYWLRYDSITV